MYISPLAIVLIIAGVLYAIYKYWESESINRQENIKHAEKERERAIEFERRKAQDEIQKAKFENTIDLIKEATPEKYPYSTAELIRMLDEYAQIRYYVELTTDNLKKWLDFGMRCEESIKFVKQTLKEINTPWDDELDFLEFWGRYIPLDKCEKTEVLNLIPKVKAKINEKEQVKILKKHLEELYHTHFRKASYYYTKKEGGDIFITLTLFVDVQELLEMNDDELLVEMEDALYLESRNFQV